MDGLCQVPSEPEYARVSGTPFKTFLCMSVVSQVSVKTNPSEEDRTPRARGRSSCACGLCVRRAHAATNNLMKPVVSMAARISALQAHDTCTGQILFNFLPLKSTFKRKKNISYIAAFSISEV